MNYRSLTLACTIGLSAVLFAGCGNNNDVGTRSTNRGNLIGTHAYHGLNNRGGMLNGGTYGGTGSTGMSTSSIGNSGIGGTYGGTGISPLGTSGFGGTYNGTGTTGMGTYGGTGTSGFNGTYGGTSTSGFGGNTATGTGSYTGTSSGGTFGSLSATGGFSLHDPDTLLFGNLMIVGPKSRNTMLGTTGGTGTDGTSLTRSTHAQAFGQQFRVLRVTDSKAVAALHRLKRNLTGSSITTKSDALAKDLRYVLKKATVVRGTTAGGGANATGFTGGRVLAGNGMR
ncbi:hypothetical protein [Cohnella candidum]|uniref:Uncharacterized protein n=1 Tax=Cohnella candidum TaxID=2674991 RepID=A0A3G3K0J4_9BACL|nr:hypothetical protein [Cohnella candidum]AYQ73912.1 hypothetical protein EAV92_15810 [Cohnella candidum]